MVGFMARLEAFRKIWSPSASSTSQNTQKYIKWLVQTHDVGPTGRAKNVLHKNVTKKITLSN